MAEQIKMLFDGSWNVLDVGPDLRTERRRGPVLNFGTFSERLKLRLEILCAHRAMGVLAKTLQKYAVGSGGRVT